MASEKKMFENVDKRRTRDDRGIGILYSSPEPRLTGVLSFKRQLELGWFRLKDVSIDGVVSVVCPPGSYLVLYTAESLSLFNLLLFVLFIGKEQTTH